jgi:hypothetical protein
MVRASKIAPRVTSSSLCKSGEVRVFHSRLDLWKSGADDAIHTFYVHKANQRPSTAANLHEAELDHVGGAQFAP